MGKRSKSGSKPFAISFVTFLCPRACRRSCAITNVAWLDFIAAYGRVVEDGSLSRKNKKKGLLKTIDSVTFGKRKPGPFDADSLLSVRWEIYWLGERALAADLKTTPDLQTAGALYLSD